MSTGAFRRDLDAELAQHFHGTADERVGKALELGRRMLAIFMSTLPPGTSRAEAEALMRKRTHGDRRPSAVMDLPRG